MSVFKTVIVAVSFCTTEACTKCDEYLNDFRPTTAETPIKGCRVDIPSALEASSFLSQCGDRLQQDCLSILCDDLTFYLNGKLLSPPDQLLVRCLLSDSVPVGVRKDYFSAILLIKNNEDNTYTEIPICISHGRKSAYFQGRDNTPEQKKQLYELVERYK